MSRGDQVRLKSVVLNPIEKSDGSAHRFVGLEHVASGLGKLIDDELPEKEASDSVCHRPGDVLFGKLRPYLAKSFLASEPAIATGELAVLRPSVGLDSRYLLYVTLSRPFLEWANQMSYGSKMPRVAWEDLGEYRMFLPSLEEQRRIADFLDAETVRIDRLHALREKQLEILEEKAVRHVYDVVRGAGVEGRRKPSNLSWLGSIPAHWRVAAVSHYFEVELGKMLDQKRSRGKHLRPYLRVANVQWGKVDTSDLAMMDFPPDERERYRLQKGDLLVNEGGSWPGRAAIWDGEIEEIYYQKALHRIRARGAELTSWLYFCLLVAERMRVFQVQGNSSTMTHLTREQLRPQRFPFPPVGEQECAVKFLQEWERQDELLRDALSRQLSTLTERRQALITAAVTGEIDVTTASGRGIEG